MCRLFGMSSANGRVRATFWLLEAPDSLAVQSRGEPDGTGLGVFDTNGIAQVHRAVVAAYHDPEFATEAKDVESATFIAHIRYASTGGLELRNCHPFHQRGMLFAHNGVIEGLDELERELGDYRALVTGDTDSERFFALIVREIEVHHGDITAGITSAARWVAEHLPIYALNLVLITATDMWALRYPETHPLYLLDREPGGHHGGRHLDHASGAGRMRVRSGDLAAAPAVVVASERMDEDPGWRPIAPGELVHVRPGSSIERHQVLTAPPARLLTLADLHPTAAASQAVR